MTESYIASFGLPVVVPESVRLELLLRGRPSPPPPASPPPPSFPLFPSFPPPGIPPSPPLPPPLSPPIPESPKAPVAPPPPAPGAPGRPPSPRDSSPPPPPPPVVREIVLDSGAQGVAVQDKLPPVIVLNGLSTVTVQMFQSYTDRGEPLSSTTTFRRGLCIYLCPASLTITSPLCCPSQLPFGTAIRCRCSR